MSTYDFYEWEDSVESWSTGNTRLLKGIKEENLYWLPIEKVPITEYLPFNSLAQPVLSLYKRVEWNGIYNDDDHACILRSFVEKHKKEMGYVIVHQKNKLGIIGVPTERDSMCHPGFATVFNARETDWKDEPCRTKKKLIYPSVPIIMASPKKEIKSICFELGERACDRDIPDPGWADCDDLSDD